MYQFSIAILLLAVTTSARAQDGITFPTVTPAPQPAPTAATKLTGSALYVVFSDKPFQLEPGTLGLVSVTMEAGPLRIRAKFADGGGKVETRTIPGKFIALVEATGTGRVDLLVFQEVGKAVIRKTIDVAAGDGPQPPPTPTPNKIAAHVTFIGAEKTADGLATNNDPALRAWLKDQGIKVHVFRATDPGIELAGLSAAVAQVGGTPCVIAQDAVGNVLGQGILSSVDGVKLLVTPYLKK